MIISHSFYTGILTQLFSFLFFNHIYIYIYIYKDSIQYVFERFFPPACFPNGHAC